MLGCHYPDQVARRRAEPALGQAAGRGRPTDPRRLRTFHAADEVRAAWDNRQISLHGKIALLAAGFTLAKPEPGKYVVTTAGRELFNEIVPPELGFFNETMDKKRLESLVGECYKRLGAEVTSDLLDELKNLGFKYATQAGFTVGIDDVRIPPEKEEIIAAAQEEVGEVNANYRKGVITEGERYNRVIDTWTHATTEVEQAGRSTACRGTTAGLQPIFMMADSARGYREQMRQLAGMRGLMAKPQKKITGGIGEIIESPVTHNCKKGLTCSITSSRRLRRAQGAGRHGAKTADAGYLTRRLVDVAPDIIINETTAAPSADAGRRAQGRRGHHRAARGPCAGPCRGRGRHPSDLERDHRRGGAADRRRDRGASGGGGQGGSREDADPQRADVRRAPRRVRQVLRPQPGDRAPRRPRRGGRRDRRAVDRRARDAADAPDVPHRRCRRTHRRAVPRHVEGPRHGALRRPRAGAVRGRVRRRAAR